MQVFNNTSKSLALIIISTSLIGKCSIDCSPNADCVKDKPNQSHCACVEGFEGDGQICVGKFQMIVLILKFNI